MKVRARKKATQKASQPMPRAQAFSFPSPILGLVLNENIAMASPGGAHVLDNWICSTTGIRPRAGTSLHIPLSAPVRSMFTYTSGSTETAFGATDGDIFNITTAGGSTPAASVTGQTSGYYAAQQFGTAGGDYLYAVNGTDKAQLFDGATWAQVDDLSTPAITGAVTSDLSYVWSFASRLFFIEKNTLTVWYLPVDSIGGALQSFSLAGIFNRGGSLMFGATWSLDAGDGLDDKCVFVSDQGEVAVYEGTNPGSAADWRKAGVYNVSVPLGAKAKMQAGGDLLIATRAGLVSIAQAIQTDVAALELGAVSAPISPIWQDKAASLTGRGWDVVKWPEKNIMMISQPGDREDTCLIANLKTGAWSRFTGLNVQCLAMFDGSAFFGGADGNVYRFESGGSDNGASYTCAFLGRHSDLGAIGIQKTVAQMRVTFKGSSRIAPQVSAKTDYSTILSSPPGAAVEVIGGATWGASLWGAATWGGDADEGIQAYWVSIGRTGYSVAPEVQMTFGGVAKPDVEMVGVDATFHLGGLVT